MPDSILYRGRNFAIFSRQLMMNQFPHNFIRAACYLSIFLAATAHATVTNVVWYRLGENDPGAVIGALATNTWENSGTINLPLVNAPLYSADVSPAALHEGSSVSMQFTNGQWGTNAVIPGIVDNFGMECWVKPAATNGMGQVIAYNGHTAFNGWGLLIAADNTYDFLFGGQTILGTSVVQPNVWAHLALVRDNGMTTLYVNGQPTVTSSSAPAAPGSGFGIAAPPENPSNQFFAGLIDEVRVFTFAPGQFSTNDLLLNQAVTHSFAVTTLADNGLGSLRSSIANAEDNDVITFATNGTLSLTSGELQISKSLTITGPGATNLTVSGNNSTRVFNVVASNATVVIQDLTISQGFVAPPAPGGGVNNAGDLTLNSCVLTGNVTGDGPGIDGGFGGPGAGMNGKNSSPGGAIYNSGSLLLNACTLYNDHAGSGSRGGDAPSGGYAGNGGSAGNGGAIYNLGIANIVQCTITGNSTGNGGGGGAIDFELPLAPDVGGDGGAGGSGGAVFNAGTLKVIASTIVGNSVGSGGGGGPGGSGGGNGAGGAPGAGGGLYNAVSASAAAINTIIATNSGDNPDVAGFFASLGHNLIGQANNNGFTNGVNGDLAGSASQPLDPRLGPLANNGGQILTLALEPVSPALDTGDDAILSPPYSLTGDQRGFPRKFGAHVDIGALESQIVFPNPVLTTLPITPTQNQILGNWIATLQGTVNLGGYPTTVYFQFGISTAYGGTAPAGSLLGVNTSNNPVSATISNLLDSRTYHYRVAATNAAGTFFGQDQTFSTALVPAVIGDLNGDGIVDQSELFLVESNYFRTSPWLLINNPSGLGGSNVTFALTNFMAGNVTVEYSTNLPNWLPLGPAIPRYLFTDTNAPGSPQRYYRLRWP